MLDTIELLDAIGQNATLRYASTDVLAHTLEQVDASSALKAATLSGDSSLLADELGQKKIYAPHTQFFWGDED
ncbi:hypothetical protein GCM10008098_07120 [Rhodanobacter panaciterrae]|uniref:Uncharacterized protein n=1 Tax=Rhodanobacter panaciterrae TaxID=490572 RepID=A0ABQ2ZKX0_9GAMM|nr:hypothetical protein [Rhodanobacter panaciterrae]GGY17912.1 hypothetical protein GCM10008098_07120 [Rhodanobacter panaciterrae]